MEKDDLVTIMIDFCEENWSAFMQRAEERGYDEEEIEKLLVKIMHGGG